ncbi:MAG: hypothetical protein QXZ44_04910 [Ferroplasma sp.]
MLNKKNILIIASVMTAILMIGVPLSAASTPVPSYLAAGSTMDYVTSTSITYNNQTYVDSSMPTLTTCTGSSTSTNYMNYSIDTSNSTIVNYTLAGVTAGTSTEYMDVPVAHATYMMPVYISHTSKNVTVTCVGIMEYLMESGITTGSISDYKHSGYSVANLTYTSMKAIPYYKSDVGTVEAMEFTFSNNTIVFPASSTTAASYLNFTANMYFSTATNLLLNLSLSGYFMHISSGKTSSTEDYSNATVAYSADLASSNVVPIHTDYIPAYIGIAVAIVLLGIAVYYFYGRKHEAPKTQKPEEHKEEQKDGNEKKE